MTTVRPAHRFTMKKGLVAPIGLTAMVLASLAVGLPAAQAANDGDEPCVPSGGTDDAFGTWERTSFTDWQKDLNPPADPDGEDGEGNLANISYIGEVDTKSVPGTEDVKITDWRAESPGTGWAQIARQTVVESEAVPATEDAWTDRTWHNYTGSQPGPNEPPALDDQKWNALPADPQSENHAFESHSPNVPYNVSNDQSGRGAWFLWTATFVPGNPGHDAVTREEYKFKQVTSTPGHTEYRWSFYERINTPGTTATDCPPEEPNGPVDPIDPADPTDPSEPMEPVEPVMPSQPIVSSLPHEPSVQNVASQQNPSTQNITSPQPATPARTSPAVPLSIDAGL